MGVDSYASRSKHHCAAPQRLLLGGDADPLARRVVRRRRALHGAPAVPSGTRTALLRRTVCDMPAPMKWRARQRPQSNRLLNLVSGASHMKIGKAQRRGTTVNWGGVAILRQTISMAEIPSEERPRPRSQYLRLRRGEIVGSGYWVEPLAADPKACMVHYRAGRILSVADLTPGWW